MYHVLVFQQGGKYVLDSAGEQGEEPVPFNSLDELVLFLTGHNLRVEDEEVQLTEVCLCADDSARLSSNCMLPYYYHVYEHAMVLTGLMSDNFQLLVVLKRVTTWIL